MPSENRAQALVSILVHHPSLACSQHACSPAQATSWVLLLGSLFPTPNAVLLPSQLFFSKESGISQPSVSARIPPAFLKGGLSAGCRSIISAIIVSTLNLLIEADGFLNQHSLNSSLRLPSSRVILMASPRSLSFLETPSSPAPIPRLSPEMFLLLKAVSEGMKGEN